MKHHLLLLLFASFTFLPNSEYLQGCSVVPMYTFGNDMIFMYNTSYDNFREKSLLFMIYDVYPP